MENQIIDVSDQVFNVVHRSIRFGLTLMVWSGMILFFADQLTTPPVMAHHHTEMTK
jgi:hypothetical protein